MKKFAWLALAFAFGFMGWQSSANAADRGFHPGDTMVVTWSDSPMMIGHKEVARPAMGDRLRVSEIRGNWIGVYTDGDTSIGGWIYNPLAPAATTRRLSVDVTPAVETPDPFGNSVPFAS